MLLELFLHQAVSFSIFYGINNLMLSENIAIAHSAPIIAAFLAVPLLGEKIGIFRTSAILVGFVGVLIIVKPGTDLFKIESLYPLFPHVLWHQFIYLQDPS